MVLKIRRSFRMAVKSSPIRGIEYDDNISVYLGKVIDYSGENIPVYWYNITDCDGYINICYEVALAKDIEVREKSDSYIKLPKWGLKLKMPAGEDFDKYFLYGLKKFMSDVIANLIVYGSDFKEYLRVEGEPFDEIFMDCDQIMKAKP
jgi:hypothetical protein